MMTTPAAIVPLAATPNPGPTNPVSIAGQFTSMPGERMFVVAEGDRRVVVYPSPDQAQGVRVVATCH